MLLGTKFYPPTQTKNPRCTSSTARAAATSRGEADGHTHVKTWLLTSEQVRRVATKKEKIGMRIPAAVYSALDNKEALKKGTRFLVAERISIQANRRQTHVPCICFIWWFGRSVVARQRTGSPRKCRPCYTVHRNACNKRLSGETISSGGSPKWGVLAV